MSWQAACNSLQIDNLSGFYTGGDYTPDTYCDEGLDHMEKFGKGMQVKNSIGFE